jgi:hypothetical protein
MPEYFHSIYYLFGYLERMLVFHLKGLEMDGYQLEISFT